MQILKKADVNQALITLGGKDDLKGACSALAKRLAKADPSKFDEVCEIIERGGTTVARYGGGVSCATWGAKGFTQVSWDGSRIPRGYLFVCILMQTLPE